MEFVTVTRVDCLEMLKWVRCRFGSINPKLGQTSNALNPEYSYWETLFVVGRRLFVVGRLTTRLGCVSTGRTPLLQLLSYRHLCRHTADTLWIGYREQMAITYSNDRTERVVKSCNKKFVVSDQGYATLFDEYIKYFRSEKQLNSSRKRRERAGLVFTEQLAAELTASQYLAYQDLKHAVAQSNLFACQKSLADQWDKFLGAACPTTVARILFQDEKVEAKWLEPGLLEIWPCEQIQEGSFSLQPNKGRCHSRAKVEWNNSTFFLEPSTMILKDDSGPSAPCRSHRYINLKMRGSWVRFDQIKGTTVSLDLHVHEIPIGNNVSTPILSHIKPHIFYDNIITEARDPQEEILKLLRAVRVGQKHDNMETSFPGISQVEQNSPFSTFSLKSMLGWPDVSAWQIWISCCSLYLTCHLFFNVIWPLAIRLALKQMGIELSPARRSALSPPVHTLRRSKSAPNVRFMLPPDLINYNESGERADCVQSPSGHSFIGRWINLF